MKIKYVVIKVRTILKILIFMGALLLLDVFRLKAQEYVDFKLLKTKSQNSISEVYSPKVLSTENKGNIVLGGKSNKLLSTHLKDENKLEPSADMDIYLLIGQSNMAGRGEIGDYADSVLPNVYLFNGEDWHPASNPFNRFSTVKKDIEQGLGPGYSFAKKLSEKLAKPIGLIVNARGGTSLEQWQKGFE